MHLVLQLEGLAIVAVQSHFLSYALDVPVFVFLTSFFGVAFFTVGVFAPLVAIDLNFLMDIQKCCHTLKMSNCHSSFLPSKFCNAF